MNTIKLKPKQLEIFKQTMNQKAELSKLLQEVNNKEMLMLELVFEQHDIEGEVSGIKLEEDKLIFDINKPASKPKEEEIKLTE